MSKRCSSAATSAPPGRRRQRHGIDQRARGRSVRRAGGAARAASSTRRRCARAAGRGATSAPAASPASAAAACRRARTRRCERLSAAWPRVARPGVRPRRACGRARRPPCAPRSWARPEVAVDARGCHLRASRVSNHGSGGTPRRRCDRWLTGTCHGRRIARAGLCRDLVIAVALAVAADAQISDRRHGRPARPAGRPGVRDRRRARHPGRPQPVPQLREVLARDRRARDLLGPGRRPATSSAG